MLVDQVCVLYSHTARARSTESMRCVDVHLCLCQVLPTKWRVDQIAVRHVDTMGNITLVISYLSVVSAWVVDITPQARRPYFDTVPGGELAQPVFTWTLCAC